MAPLFPPILLSFLATCTELAKYPDLILVPVFTMAKQKHGDRVDSRILGAHAQIWKNFSVSTVTHSGLSADAIFGFVETNCNYTSWPPPIILLEGDGDGGANQSTLSSFYSALSEISMIKHLAHDEYAAPPGYPWIFVLLCEETSKDFLISSPQSVARSILPQSYQINSRVYLVTCTALFEAYYIRERLVVRQLQLSFYALALASKEPPESEESHTSTVFRRKDFMREWILTAHARNVDFTAEWSKKTVKLDNYFGGGSYSLLGCMQDFLNFPVTILGSNGSWYLMADRVWNKEVDFGLSSTGMIASVIDQYRFLVTPTYTDQANAHFSERVNPDALRQSQAPLFMHLKPFQREAWLMIGLLALLLFTCHHVTMRRDEMADSFWMVLTSLTLKSVYPLESQNSLRIMALVGSFSGLVLYAFYSAELISSLSTYKEQKYTLRTLIHEGYTFGILNISYLRAAKEKNDFGQDSISTKLYTQLDSVAGELPNLTSGVTYAFQHQKFAFVTEETGVYQTIESDPVLKQLVKEQDAKNRPLCSYFHSIPIPEFTVYQAPISRKGAPFLKHLNVARARVYESGVSWLYARRRLAYQSRFDQPCPPIDRIYFTFRDVLLPFYVLGIGAGVCCVSFLVEVIGLQAFGFGRREVQF